MSSSRKRAKGEKKQEHTKAPKAKPAKPTGKAPEAMVTTRHRTGFVTRVAKGFSMGELVGAGLSPSLVSSWGVGLDLRRRSVIDSNVASLKSWGAHTGATKRMESRAKVVEEEIEKVGREVKKEAVKVEREVEKVGREMKEEAVKAEKVARRKSKPKKKKAEP